MTPFALTRLQADNYTALARFREVARNGWHGREGSALFPNEETASAYAELDDGQILSLAVELDVSVCVPRYSAEDVQTLLAHRAPGLDGVVLDGWTQSNLNFLIALRQAAINSVPDVAWEFLIDRETVRAYVSLSDEQVWFLATHSPLPIAVPRFSGAHLRRILARPKKARGVFAAVTQVDAQRRHSRHPNLHASA